MKERPILFSAGMVRALLDGSKTQTRRVCKPADGLSYVVAVQDPNERGQRPPYYTPGWFGDEDGEIQFFCPYGQPGDRLWVREAWTTHKCFDNIPPRDLTTRSLHYQADGQIKTGKNRPGMFMPRWASRITLEITAVRVERLQDISADDAMAEGVVQVAWYLEDMPACNEYRYAYEDLWRGINGRGSWEANPWVWVIEFKRVTP